MWILIAQGLPAAGVGAEPSVAPAAVAVSSRFAADVRELAALLDASAYTAALARADSLLPLIRAELPAGSFDEAKVLDFEVHAFYRSSRVMEPAALSEAVRAVALKEALLGPDHPELANSLMHLGNLRSRRWELDEALPPYERALAILAAAGPGFDDQRAIILSGEGVVHRRLGQNRKALELFGEALEIQERLLGPQHPDVASTLNNLALVLGERGDYAAAVALHRRALAIREAHFGPDHEWVGESANNLASQLGYLGRYDEALAAQERAVRIFHDRLGPDHQRYWLAKLNLGVAYLDMGDPAGAQPICREVLDGLVTRYGEGYGQSCFARDALANCHFGLGDYGTALAIYTTSLQVSEAAYGVGSYDTADTILQQGKCLIALGRLDEAVERIERSLAIWEAELGPDNAQICDLLNRLAELHLRRGEPGRALACAERARTIGRRDLGRGHPLVAASTLLAGQAEHGLGRDAAALDDALLAEAISRDHLQRTMRVLSEARALDYAGSRVEGLDLAVSVLADGEVGDRVARVWDGIIHSRSAVLDEYTARNRTLSRREDAAAAALVDSSLVLRERLANLTLRGPGWEEVAVYHQLLTDAEDELNAVERLLSLRSAAFRRRDTDRHTGFAEVAAALPAGCALAAFVRCADDGGREAYKVFALPGAGAEPRFHDLGDARRIDAAVGAWRDQAALGARQAAEPGLATRGFLKVPRDADARLAAYAAAGADLRRLVWDPLADEVAGAATVFLVADGGLHLVSFPSLPLDDGRYLAEAGAIVHLLTSERSLAVDRGAAPAPGRLLAVGNPDHPQPGVAELTFAPLTHAAAEVEQVAAIWSRRGGEAVLLLGADASEARVQQNLPGAQVLHLATHGYFLPGAVVGGASARWDNPLVRSGLVLTPGADGEPGAGSGRDGILTAAEISALDLSGVQWAVLSACDTGLGELDTRGEGVFGLRRVFALAGARTVIMSLWSVDDAASSDWMQVLYRAHWQDGLSTAEAVRVASLETLAARRAAGLSTHPYYWAGFVAAGDWR